jgi:hypothetical protein
MDLVELLLDTSSSDEDEEGEMLVEAVQLMTRRRIQRINPTKVQKMLVLHRSVVATIQTMCKLRL